MNCFFFSLINFPCRTLAKGGMSQNALWIFSHRLQSVIAFVPISIITRYYTCILSTLFIELPWLPRFGFALENSSGQGEPDSY
jgi:hypothetical protein